MTFHYDPPTAVNAGKCQPGLAAMDEAVAILYPSSSDLGCYAPRNVAGSTHPSAHRNGRAQDRGFRDPGNMPTAWAGAGGDLARRLTNRHEVLGVQAVIYYRRVWGFDGGPSWRAYTGPNPHTDHVHWELTLEAAARPWSTGAWLAALTDGRKPLPPKEETVTEAQMKLLEQWAYFEHVKLDRIALALESGNTVRADLLAELRRINSTTAAG